VDDSTPPIFPSQTFTTRPRERAPDFRLSDHFGNTVSLHDTLATGCGIVVFFRGHWCPYCRRYLTKLQANFSRFTALGASLVAISPEDPRTSQRLAAELQVTFPLLCDPEGRTIDAYQVRNSFSSVRTLLPHPAAFVIDGRGTITFKSVDRNYKKRTTLRTLLHQTSAVTGQPLSPILFPN